MRGRRVPSFLTCCVPHSLGLVKLRLEFAHLRQGPLTFLKRLGGVIGAQVGDFSLLATLLRNGHQLPLKLSDLSRPPSYHDDPVYGNGSGAAKFD